MEKYSPTPAERRWCIDTIARISDYIPKHYTGVIKARLQKKGIEVDNRYITDCRNMKRHDVNVVKELEQMARDLNRLPRISNRADILRKKK